MIFIVDLPLNEPTSTMNLKGIFTFRRICLNKCSLNEGYGYDKSHISLTNLND